MEVDKRGIEVLLNYADMSSWWTKEMRFKSTRKKLLVITKWLLIKEIPMRCFHIKCVLFWLKYLSIWKILFIEYISIFIIILFFFFDNKHLSAQSLQYYKEKILWFSNIIFILEKIIIKIYNIWKSLNKRSFSSQFFV